MKSPRLPERLEFAVKSQVRTALAGEPPELVELGMHLLDRISPPNWTLEWSLPGWLGSTLRLDAPIIAALTLANVYGLAYVRLQDDLIDGEVAESDRPAALLLSSVFHRKWLLVYVGVFPEESPFWGFFERYLAQWVAATLHSRREPDKTFRDYDETDLRGLGQRGAPLKICAVGACLLAQREGLIPQIDSALDHLLIGAVLLDHALDWAGDLAAGRYNAFIAYATEFWQTPEYTEANRRAVMEELLVGKAARPYFDVIRRQLRAAADVSHTMGMAALTDYLIWLRRQADDYGRRLARDGRDQLHALAGRILQPAPTAEYSVAS